MSAAQNRLPSRSVAAGALALLVTAANLFVPSRADAGSFVGDPEIGYWTDTNVEIADAEGTVIGAFPDLEHFSFSGPLLAGERQRPRSHNRIVGYDITSGEPQFRIYNAVNPVVADPAGKVFFLPTFHREKYTMSVWMRRASGSIMKIAQFKPGPGLPGIRHGMRAGGVPLDLAVDDRGRYVAVAFGLETVRAFDVWIIDAKTKEATRMTRGENSHNPSLSPDGTQLAVRVESPDPCPDDLYGEILVGKIRLVSRATGERRTLTEWDCDVFYDTPRWVDNGSLLAVRVTKDAAETYGYDLDIVEIDASTGEISEVVTEGNPCCITVSPSLGKVAFPYSDVPGATVFDLATSAMLELPENSYVPHLSGEDRF